MNLWSSPPSYTLSVIALALFTVITVFFALFTASRHHQRRCFWFAFLGGCAEIAAYALRMCGSDNLNSTGFYAAHTLCTLLGPLCYEATLYRLWIYYKRGYGGKKTKPWVINTVYVCETLSWLTMIGGAICYSQGVTSIRYRGDRLILMGLVTEFLLCGTFLRIAIMFHKKKEHMAQAATPLLSFIKVGLAVMLIRTTYRLVEAVDGYQGYFLSHEVYFYCFDPLLVFFVHILMSLIRPYYVNSLTKVVRALRSTPNIELASQIPPQVALPVTSIDERSAAPPSEHNTDQLLGTNKHVINPIGHQPAQSELVTLAGFT